MISAQKKPRLPSKSSQNDFQFNNRRTSSSIQSKIEMLKADMLQKDEVSKNLNNNRTPSESFGKTLYMWKTREVTKKPEVEISNEDLKYLQNNLTKERMPVLNKSTNEQPKKDEKKKVQKLSQERLIYLSTPKHQNDSKKQNLQIKSTKEVKKQEIQKSSTLASLNDEKVVDEQIPKLLEKSDMVLKSASSSQSSLHKPQPPSGLKEFVHNLEPIDLLPEVFVPPKEIKTKPSMPIKVNMPSFHSNASLKGLKQLQKRQASKNSMKSFLVPEKKEKFNQDLVQMCLKNNLLEYDRDFSDDDRFEAILSYL